ncbi:DHA2 family efflux MFS transporter permease subunit [Klebsiella pneumoniae]|nr:DHA2 family efflux MFS transporter permease subunit [Klebsiella pneumoniae]
MNPASKKSVLVLAALGAAALAAASYGAYWWHTGRFMQTTDDAYVGGDISAISSKVSGYIQQLAVQDNMAVKKGDLLIRIDDRDYRAALAKAAGEVAAQQAALADIQATRQLQQATIAGSAASLLAATAATEKLANDNRRYNALAASSAISAQIRDNASADYRRAHAEQEKAKADKTVAERQLAVLDARQQQILAALAQAQANLEMARLNLSYTDIRAPFDGVIGNRRAWSGSFVSSGTQLLSLVPAHGLWIDANFKENQLAHMRAGQPVTIVADVLPNHTFKGHVASLAPATGSRFSILPAENATGNFTKIVQRVPVRIFFQGKQRVIAAATIGGLASLAPTLGPTVGGWITENYNWHWLFFINVVPGIYIAVAVPLLVKVDSAAPTLLRGADYLSILLLALSLGCLEYTLEEGPRWGWFDDATLTTTAWVALLCGVAFVIRTLRHPQPVMDLRALQDRTFSLGCYFSFMAGVGIFATIYLTPLYLGSVRGFSALEIGLAVFSTGLFQVMSIPFYSWLANRVDLRWLLMAGLIGFAVSMYSFVPITHDWGADQLLLPQAFRGLAQQFAVAPTVTLTLGSLPPARLKLASGLFNLMRNLGGAIGIALCGTVLNDRTNLHYSRLADHLNNANLAMSDFVQRSAANFTVQGISPDAAQTAALKNLSALALREARTQAFSDAFYLIMMGFLLAALLVPLMKKPPAH